MLFWIACIPSRIVLAMLPLLLPATYLVPLGYIVATIATAFLVLWTCRLRMTAIEAGGPTWWHEWRLVHGLVYTVAAAYLLTGNRDAWMFLMIDVGIGITARLSKP